MKAKNLIELCYEALLTKWLVTIFDLFCFYTKIKPLRILCFGFDFVSVKASNIIINT